MKFIKLIALITIISIVSCNEENKTDGNYIQEYYGKKLTIPQIDSLFKFEEELYDYVLSNRGKVEIIEKDTNIQNILNNNKKDLNVKNKNIDITKYIGFDFGSLPKEIYTSDISLNDFKIYYFSLSKVNRYNLISSKILHGNYSFISQDRDIQIFILNEYSKYNNQNYNRLNFLTKYEYPNYLDSIYNYLLNINNTPNTYITNRFLSLLYKNNRKSDAINLFEILVSKYIENQKKDKKTNRLIFISEIDPNTELLFDTITQQRYINTCLNAIESNSLELYFIEMSIQFLWRSGKLNEKQKERIVKYSQSTVKNHKTYNTYVFNELQVCFNSILADYYGFDYLLKYKDLGHYNSKSNLPFFAIKHIVKYHKLNNKQKRFIVNFVNNNYDKDRTKWNLFCCADGKETFIKNISNKNLQENGKSDEIDEIRSTLKSMNLYNDKSYKLFEKERVKQSQGLKLKEPLPLKVVWSMIGRNVPEVKIEAEAGQIPLDYEKMAKPFVEVMETKFGIPINIAQLNLNYDELKPNDTKNIEYDIYINSENSNEVYKISIKNTGNWYYPPTLVRVLNMILIRNNLHYRWIQLETYNQLSNFILINPEKYKILNDKYNIKKKYLY